YTVSKVVVVMGGPRTQRKGKGDMLAAMAMSFVHKKPHFLNRFIPSMQNNPAVLVFENK
ncbi:hypothetical protein BaRGS_00028722, partial [Batillaria attramentaria]